MSTKLQVAGVGEVVVLTKSTAKTIRLSVRPGRPVTVTMPPRTPLRLVTSFVASKSNWITIQRARYPEEVVAMHDVEALRRQAKQILPAKLSYFAATWGMRYAGVTIKNMRSRWGSCSSTNHINLSLFLVLLPEELCDYVLLHELAHTVQKNHQVDFWQTLDELCGGPGMAKKIDRKLTVWTKQHAGSF